MTFEIGDKVRIERNGRTGIITAIQDDGAIAFIEADDMISMFTAAFVRDPEHVR